MSSQVANIHSRFESGDLVYRTRVGTELLRVRSDGSGITFANSGSTDSWVFNVKAPAYGAVGDGTTDDTAAVNAAVAAAFAYAQSSPSAYAEVYFPLGVYLLGGATTKGGATAGNAQIPIPIQAATARKVTLVFRGQQDATAFPYWTQTTPQRWGVTLKTSLTGQTIDSAWGVPSVVGGPAVSGSSATYGTAASAFNNVLLVWQGIAIQTPLDPTIAGLDARGLAQVAIPNMAVICDATTAQMVGTTPTHSQSAGVLLPQNLNNDELFIGNLSVQGQYTGVSVSAHTVAVRLGLIYCHDAIYVQADGNDNHASWLGNVSAEVCVNGLLTDGNPSFGPIAVNIGMFDCESVTNHFVDPNGALGGTVYYADNDVNKKSPTIAAGHAGNIEIISARRPRGNVTAPGMPSSTTALVNPFYRHAAVNITGGTVTVIKVDGVTTGLTSGTVIVPSGKSVAITYSVAPTWVWTLL